MTSLPRFGFLGFLVLFLLFFHLPLTVRAQENPYIVAYDHYLEEPGNLEIEYFSTFGTQRGGNDFHAFWAEFEYGATAWWTTEFYLDGQSTFSDSTVFTGFRWENRFRPLKQEHFINPVIYIEYENTIATKNLTGGNPWEFGYALGASRPLALKASAKRCSFCRENFIAGAELYGSLGDRYSFGLHNTSHYFAPVLAWNLPSDWTLRLSAGFGLNDRSHRFLLRWGVSREITGFGSMIGRLFGGHR